MTTIVIKSNHGNHTGFNRKWEVLNGGDSFDSEIQAMRYLAGIADEEDEQYDEEKEEFVLHGPIGSFNYDLYYYAVVTQSDYDNGFFDGGHNGYANKKIKDIFEPSEDNV